MAAEAFALACAYCDGGSQPFDLDDDGDLVCAPGRGCSRGPGRRPTVTRSTVHGASPAAPRSPDTCACGDAAEWQELRAEGLVGCCAVCVPGGPGL